MPYSGSAFRSWPSTTYGHAARRPACASLRSWRCANTSAPHAAWHSRASTFFLRDRFTCQYCGEAFPASALTFEHVIPRSRGGRTTWSNIVTACMPCNTGKAASTRIKPRRPPKEPTLNELLAAKRAFPSDYLHESWTDYLYWDARLEP